MPVRIYFRGLVLFRFPKEPGGKLVAELISDPTRPPKPPPGSRGKPHEHRAEVQIITENRSEYLLQNGLDDKARLDITVPGGTPGVAPSGSFLRHVPRLSDVVSRATTPAIRNAKPGDKDPRYVRNTITVNRGLIRVKDVVIWDAGGFPLSGAVGDLPASLALLKFMGCDVWGHMANECVVEIADANMVEMASEAHPNLEKRPTVQPANPKTDYDTVEVLITNYEPQRKYPVPWGLDFQWLFAAAGYRPVDLTSPEFADFIDYASRSRFADLFAEDRTHLLTGSMGTPFPYLPKHHPLTQMVPLTDIDSRPVCVPAVDDGP